MYKMNIQKKTRAKTDMQKFLSIYNTCVTYNLRNVFLHIQLNSHFI